MYTVDIGGKTYRFPDNIGELDLLEIDDIETIHDIIDDPNTKRLSYPNHISSADFSIFSNQYQNCVGAVLMNHDIAGMTHYNERQSPEEYIDQLIQEMGVSPCEISALAIGGDKEHFQKLIHALAARNIAIVGGFLDSYPVSGERIYKRIREGRLWYSKGILSVPKTREVSLSLFDSNSKQSHHARLT